jgi:hypothetical protein
MPAQLWRQASRTLKGQFVALATAIMLFALLLALTVPLSFCLPANAAATAQRALLIGSLCFTFCALLATTALRMVLVTHRVVNAGLTLALIVGVLLSGIVITRLMNTAIVQDANGQMFLIVLSVIVFPLTGLVALWGIATRLKDF